MESGVRGIISDLPATSLTQSERQSSLGRPRCLATGTSRQRSRRRRRGVSNRMLVCRRSPGWTRLLPLGRRLCPALAWGLEGPLRFHNAMRPSSPITLPRLCPRLPRRTWRTTLAERRRAALSRGRLCRLRCPPAARRLPWRRRGVGGPARSPARCLAVDLRAGCVITLSVACPVPRALGGGARRFAFHTRCVVLRR